MFLRLQLKETIFGSVRSKNFFQKIKEDKKKRLNNN